MSFGGRIDSLSEVFASIAKKISGYWSGQIGKRKGFVWKGYFRCPKHSWPNRCRMPIPRSRPWFICHSD